MFFQKMFSKNNKESSTSTIEIFFGGFFKLQANIIDRLISSCRCVGAHRLLYVCLCLCFCACSSASDRMSVQ